MDIEVTYMFGGQLTTGTAQNIDTIKDRVIDGERRLECYIDGELQVWFKEIEDVNLSIER
jgi:hypothetical protein